MLSFREVSPGDDELQQAQQQAGIALPGKVYAARLCRLEGVSSVKVDAHTERLPLLRDTRFFASAISVPVLVRRATDSAFGASPSEP
jgi:hypothetical protein